jgi:hypothetical protein
MSFIELSDSLLQSLNAVLLSAALSGVICCALFPDECRRFFDDDNDNDDNDGGDGGTLIPIEVRTDA